MGVSNTGQVDSQQQLQAAMASLGQVGQHASALQGMAFNGFQSSFGPGGAAGRVGSMVAHGQATFAAPASASIAAEDQFMPMAPPAPGRNLHAVSSDPDPKRARKGVAAGSTGELAVKRQQGQAMIQDLQVRFLQAKVHGGKLMQASYKGKQMPANAKDLVSAHGQLVDRLNTAKKGLASWTMSTADTELQKIGQLDKDFATTSASISSHRSALVTRAAAERGTANAESLRLTRERTARCKIYRDGLTPANLCRWLHDQGGLFTEPMSPAEVSVEQDALRAAPKSTFSIWQSDDADGGWQEPVSIPASTAEDRSAFLKVYDMVGTVVFDTAAGQCEDSLVDHPNSHSRTRIPCGQLESMTWVPDSWKSQEVTPASVRGYGAPWCMVSRAGACRFDFEWYPIGQHAHLLYQVTGAITVVSWPISSVVDRGCNLNGQAKFLFSELNASHFAKWADQNARYQTVGQGAAVWIPFGWSALILGRPTRSGYSQTLLVPFVNAEWEHTASPWARKIWEHTATCLTKAKERKQLGWQKTGQAWFDDLRQKVLQLEAVRLRREVREADAGEKMPLPLADAGASPAASDSVRREGDTAPNQFESNLNEVLEEGLAACGSAFGRRRSEQSEKPVQGQDDDEDDDEEEAEEELEQAEEDGEEVPEPES